jgi:hypothetical protein
LPIIEHLILFSAFADVKNLVKVLDLDFLNNLILINCLVTRQDNSFTTADKRIHLPGGKLSLWQAIAPLSNLLVYPVSAMV